MLGGHNDLNIFQGGSITGTFCCSIIILSLVRLSRGAMGFQILFVGDNATYPTSYSGCFRAFGEWGYESHGFARKVHLTLAKCVLDSRKTLDSISRATSNNY